MATGSGQLTSYSNTIPQKTMISDRIILADVYDIPTITALGLNNEAKFRFVNTPGRTYEWLEDVYPEVTDTAAGTNLTVTTNTTTITITYPNRFHVGDVIQLGDAAAGVTDLAVVSSISGSVLTVARGFGGVASVSHAETITVYIRGTARLEGASNSDSPWTEVTSNTNCSQIFHRSVEVTRDDQKFPNYGITDLVNYRIDKNMDILMKQLNALPFYGKRAAGTSSTSRGAGGFWTFITTNTTGLSSAALTRAVIDTELEQIFTAGGTTDLIICDTWGQRKINDMYEGYVSTGRAESIGGILVKQLQHPITGKLVDVMVDRDCPAGYMYMIDRSVCGYITVDPFFYEELAKTKDNAATGQTVGEYGFVCAANKFHSILWGYSTTA
jgi:hypothetical protein